jgi:hypothetical protein
MRRALLILVLAALAFPAGASAIGPDPAPGASHPAYVVPGRYVCSVHVAWGEDSGGFWASATSSCRYVFDWRPRPGLLA